MIAKMRRGDLDSKGGFSLPDPHKPGWIDIASVCFGTSGLMLRSMQSGSID
jgi:hypothetical protein